MLSVRHLSITFRMYDVGLRQKELTVISDLSLDVAAGEVAAVVGSNGSGKSLLAHAVLGILPRNATAQGELSFKGAPLTPARQAALRGREMALIPQSVSFLDPLMRAGAQARRAAQLAGHGVAAADAQRQAFSRYGLTSAVERLYPFQVSGGMARRVLTALATVGCADLIIADEPTPGLHPEAVVETLGHLRELADKGRAVMLITHDLEAALDIADTIAVFYAGNTIEVANRVDFLTGGAAGLRHPYTRALWCALPQNAFRAVPGAQPPADSLPPGCLYAPRCQWATDECRIARPDLRPLSGGLVRCVHAEVLIGRPACSGSVAQLSSEVSPC